VTDGDESGALRRRKIGTVAQWNAAGLSRQQLRTLVRRGGLVPVRHGVYATPGYYEQAAADPRHGHALQAIAAMLATSTRPVIASHESAARIHGLELLNPPPEDLVTVTRLAGNRTARGQHIRFVAAKLIQAHVVRRYDVPVTTAARTVIDLARSLPFMDGVVVADSALGLDLVTKTELMTVLDLCGGWPGADRARRVAEFSCGLAESVLESCARVVFDRNGLEPPELQVRFKTAEGSYRADFYWRRHFTIAEADGLVKYDTRGKAVAQLRRDQHLREAGQHVLHFTWEELFTQERDLIARISETFGTPPPKLRQR